MSTQSTPGQSFPTPCKRCGGALYPPDDTCPWCGASHAVAYGVRLKPQGHALPPDNPTAHAPDPVQPAAHMPPMMLPDTPIPPLSMPVPLWKSAGKWIFSRGIVLVVFVVALAYSGYTLFGDHKTDNSADEPAAKSATGTIVPYEAPAASAPAPQAVASIAPTPVPTPMPVPAPSPAPAPARAKSPALPSTSAVPAPAPAPVVLPPLPPRVATRHRSVPESLQAARAGLQSNDLSGAQAALSDVLAAEPDNADARLMQQDLLQRTMKRDNALRNASVCATDRLWSCVRHNATDALAIDSTNPNVKALLERAIREAGWNSPALPTARGGAQATAPTATARANVPAPTARGNVPATTARANVAPRVARQAPAPAPAPASAPAPATAQAAAANPPASTPTSPSPSPAVSPATTNANDANSVDARERAIRESGWSRPAASSAATASASTAVH